MPHPNEESFDLWRSSDPQVVRNSGVKTKKTVSLKKNEFGGFLKKLHEKFPDVPLKKMCFSYELLKRKNHKKKETFNVDCADKDQVIPISNTVPIRHYHHHNHLSLLSSQPSVTNIITTNFH